MLHSSFLIIVTILNISGLSPKWEDVPANELQEMQQKLSQGVTELQIAGWPSKMELDFIVRAAMNDTAVYLMKLEDEHSPDTTTAMYFVVFAAKEWTTMITFVLQMPLRPKPVGWLTKVWQAMPFVRNTPNPKPAGWVIKFRGDNHAQFAVPPFLLEDRWGLPVDKRGGLHALKDYSRYLTKAYVE